MSEHRARAQTGGAERVKVKGTLLVARMRFLRAGRAADLERVLGLLPLSEREVLQGILLPSSWYPEGMLHRLDAAIAAVLSPAARARSLVEVGRFSAQTSLGPGGVQRPFLRAGEPHHLLERVPRMYLAQHSSGSRAYQRIDDQSAIIRRFDEGAVAGDDCLVVVGWLQRAVELSGGRDVRVEEGQCRMRGAPHCEYTVRWS